MIVSSFGQSLSYWQRAAGFWHSTNANEKGREMGIQEPVIDKLVELVIESPDRESLISRTRALDRVLLWNTMLSRIFIFKRRVSFWNIFGRPKNVAKYSVVS